MANSYTVPDPRDEWDIILDDVPRVRSASISYARPPIFTPRAESLLGSLLALGEFTAESAAAECQCYESSVRTTIRNHPAYFEQVTVRCGDVPGRWRAV